MLVSLIMNVEARKQRYLRLNQRPYIQKTRVVPRSKILAGLSRASDSIYTVSGSCCCERWPFVTNTVIILATKKKIFFRYRAKNNKFVYLKFILMKIFFEI